MGLMVGLLIGLGLTWRFPKIPKSFKLLVTFNGEAMQWLDRPV